MPMRKVLLISSKRNRQLKLTKTARIHKMQKNTYLTVKLKVNYSFTRWQLQKMKIFGNVQHKNKGKGS